MLSWKMDQSTRARLASDKPWPPLTTWEEDLKWMHSRYKRYPRDFNTEYLNRKVMPRLPQWSETGLGPEVLVILREILFPYEDGASDLEQIEHAFLLALYLFQNRDEPLSFEEAESKELSFELRSE